MPSKVLEQGLLMRVLHVLAERGWSGGETQLAHLVRHLEARGHRNALVLAPGAKFRRLAEELSLPVYEANLRTWFDPRQVLRLRSAIRAESPEILHFGCGRSLQWGGLFALGTACGVRATTRRIDYPIGRNWYRRLRYHRFVDHVVANCCSVENQVLATGLPVERVSMIHEGIDLAPWTDLRAQRTEARRKLGLPADATVISCAATLRPRKQQRLLIDAFARVASDFPAAILVLAGDGADAKALKTHAADSGLGAQIHLPGRIDPVADLWAASDAMALVSSNEGLANACLEASASALPCFVSRVGGLPEIVEDGVTGKVVPVGDVQATADALRWLLEHPHEARDAGERGAQRTRRLFAAEHMAEQMEKLFLQLLDQAPMNAT